MGIKIFADAASNLFREIRQQKGLDIKVMNMHLTLGDKEFNCYDDEFDTEEFANNYYKSIGEGVLARTSLVPPMQYIEAFEEEIKKGNKVICFTMAKGISGTYNSACLARDLVNEKYEEKNQHALIPLVHDIVAINGAMSRLAGEGEEAVLVTSYNPDDLLSEEAVDLVSFHENVCMEECKVRIFETEDGPDYQII